MNMQDLITYSVTDAALSEMRSKYIGLRVCGLDDAEGYAQCKVARDIVRKTRLSVEERRKELKAESLIFGKAVDSEARRIFEKIEEVEGHLVGQLRIVDDEKKRLEDEAIRKAKERIDQRAAQLIAFGAAFNLDEVSKMTDEAFDDLLSLSESRFRAAQRKQEEERQRLEQLEKERAAQDELLAAEREKTRQLEAEAAQMRKEQADREHEQAHKVEEEQRLAKVHDQIVEASAVIGDDSLEIMLAFPTLVLAWIEIARLRKITSKL